MKNTNYLWIPESASNRTAFLSTKIEREEGESITYNNGVASVAPFEILYREDGSPASINPNCNTVYTLLEVPEFWTMNDIYALSGIVSERCGFDKLTPSNCIRSLADCIRSLGSRRLDIIKDVLSEFNTK